jgi:hypothetical protein
MIAAIYARKSTDLDPGQQLKDQAKGVRDADRLSNLSYRT